ncbi:MAG: replication-relaxation family protein, partial [Planctomycetales bacterium]|nr:replication-relaxation family protein [Planctomycetales bacterium]
MPLTELDMAVLRAIATYYVLTREMVQQLCCASHASGRGARKRLSRLRQAGYIVQHRVPVALPDTNGAAPVYYATRKGAEALASFYGDDEFLATNTKTPRADRLAHWIAINQTRLLVEAAVTELPMVKLLRWITEWETCNKSAATSDQFYLHTQLSEHPPLSCSPDAGFLVEYQSERMVYYLEQDLATSSPRQIAARKSKG